MERHSCANCVNLEREWKEAAEGRLEGRYRYGCGRQSSGRICGFLTGDGDLEALSCGLWQGRSGRRGKGAKREKEPGERLQELFDRWNEWHQQGCPEAGETDGTYLNRLGLAIKGLTEWIEECLEESQYPESYYSPLPPMVREDYMADTERLVRDAKKALDCYRNSPDYLWLESYARERRAEGKEDREAAVFFDHVKALEDAVSRGDFLVMKQEMRQEGLLAELAAYKRAVLGKGKTARRKRRKAPKEMDGQATLFGEKVS